MLSVVMAISGVLIVFHTLEWKVGGVDEDQTVAINPVFHFFSFCIYTEVTPTRGVAVEVPYNHPVFTVRLKNVEIDCFVGRTVQVTDDPVSVWENELHGDVFRASFL